MSAEALNYEIKIVKGGSEEFEIAYQIRVEVFVVEQGIPEEEELDELDQMCTHFILFSAHKAIGTCRMVPSSSKECNLGRFAILAAYRRLGFGKRLSDAVEVEAIKAGYSSISLHAQSEYTQFYQSIGYIGDERPAFIEAGIEHIHMHKVLTPSKILKLVL